MSDIDQAPNEARGLEWIEAVGIQQRTALTTRVNAAPRSFSACCFPSGKGD
jgi:hypothetical protein